MKKIYVIVVMLLFSGYIFAQSINMPDKRNSAVTVKQNQQSKLLLDRHFTGSMPTHKSSKSSSSRWYNYSEAVHTLLHPEGPNILNQVFIFPDTTVSYRYSDGSLGDAFMHSVAVVLDPLSTVFDSETELNLNKYNKIQVDSIDMLCYYRRHIPDPDITDTLIIEVLQKVAVVGWFLDQQPYFGIDSVVFALLGYDVNLNYVDKNSTYTTPITTFKVPLTPENEADTNINGLNYISFKVPQPLAFSSIGLGVCVTVRFKPGYTWIHDQSIINEELNEFNILAYEENGEGTYPNYWSQDDYNSSQFVRSAERYKGSWSGTYVPIFAFTANFNLEDPYFGFHITTNNVGITENSAKTVKLEQNLPNPANGNTVIPYELQANTNVTMTITDLTGKKVMEISEGKQTAGNHTININTNSLSNGMYYYTLNADNTSLTRKMIVNK